VAEEEHWVSEFNEIEKFRRQHIRDLEIAEELALPSPAMEKRKYNAETQRELRIRRAEMKEGDVKSPYTAGAGLKASTYMTTRICGV
jgi:hypothetical protein